MRTPSNSLLRNGMMMLTLLGLLSACGGGDDNDEEIGVIDPVPEVGPSGLSALPNPPLTEAPSADDEPIADSEAFHTITEFAVVREGAEPLPVPESDTEVLTEADFDAGLPEVVIEIPAGTDPAQNGAPFFEGLQNTRVDAGQPLEIRFVPRDPEGQLPGVTPLRLPEGASFDDNFDGTRSLNWLPLQVDIGITEFTAIAMDPAEPAYQSSQTVLIAVDEPEDPSTIPNVAPVIGSTETRTVLVDEPAVFGLQGFDRNGTTPTIELVDPPAGSSLLTNPRFDQFEVLRVVPDAAGEMVVDLLVRDAVDTSLVTNESITLNVVDASDIARSGDRLRNLAAGHGVQIGFAAASNFYRQPDGALYGAIAAEEFNIVTPEGSMKMGLLNPLPGRFEFADTDNLMNFARAHGMAVRGHTLVWHRILPEWVEETPVAEREVHMREFITRVIERYGDEIDIWDVVNEPVGDEGGLRSTIWSEAMGESYIDTAFRQARELDPDATLVLNEFDIGFEGPKFESLLSLLDRLQERDVPVDAVGFQMHVFASYDEFDELAANMAAVAERGLDIHVSELDVAITEGESLQQQADVYQGVVETCLAQPRCTVIQTWGLSDRYSFRSFFDPLMFTRDFQAKPAYTAVQTALGG